jgi:methionyl aminopeptidase
MKNKSAKVRRNDPCPCGSGLKYKKCCINKTEASPKNNNKSSYLQKHGIRVKEAKDIEGIKKPDVLPWNTLDLVEGAIRAGMTTDEINALVHDYTIKNGATPAPLGYRGFPKSVCVSVNEVICHGIPGDRVLNNGDIVNVDVTPILNGYYADVNKTFFVGDPDSNAKKIVNVARECLRKGMMMVRPGNRIGDIGFAIQSFAEKEGCSVVREFVGHGVGFDFHEPPQVPHHGRRGEGIKLIPGMVFTIEPMINLGKKEFKVLDDGWTAVTLDGSLSAQFEQTILVTDEGYESLTPFSLQ